MSQVVYDDPIILDSTGQDIVDGLEGIKNAVQPINIYQDIEISIPLDGWSQSVPYRYTWLYQRITTECGIEVHFLEGAENVDMRYIEYEKVPGGIRFEIDQIPDAAIPLMVRIINASTTAVLEPLDATLVTQNAVPQTSNVNEGLANHEQRIAAMGDEVDDIFDKLDKVDNELALRLKSINGVPADENGDAIFNEVEFARQIVTDDAQEATGEFIERPTGGHNISLEDGPAMLVAMYGRSQHTGIVAESLNMTLNLADRDIEDPVIEAEFDEDTFKSEVSTSGTTTLTYTDSWSEDPADYGVTVTGTPISGDSIVITYVKANRGTITNSTPSKFRSIGWNLYDHSTGYAKVMKYSNQYGFLIGGAYSSLKFSETLTGTKSDITLASGYFTVPSDGYVWVTGGTDTGDNATYIIMTWSDWTNGPDVDFELYSETEIDIANMVIKTGENTTSTFGAVFTNGLMQVGAVHDEISFSMMRVISRIEKLAYEANIDAIIASGREYIADENYIYAVKASEDVYVIVTENGAYTAADHGLEIIEGTTVPVFVETLYGRNLVDYLRHDVPNAISTLNSKIATTNVQTPTVLNAGTGSTASYCKSGNLVTITYDISIATTGESKRMFTLPSDYRPKMDIQFTATAFGVQTGDAIYFGIGAGTGYVMLYGNRTARVIGTITFTTA